MATSKLGRHSAGRATMMTSITKAVAGNAGSFGRQAAVVAAASGLALTAAVPANADAPALKREATEAVALAAPSVASSAVTADVKAAPAFFSAPVTVEAAPEPVITPQSTPATAQSAPVQQGGQSAQQGNQGQQAAPKQEAAPAPAPQGGSAAASGLVAAAYGQLRVVQDCTKLVENALASIGRPVGDLAPMQFGVAGTVVSDLQPGDILMQPGHVSIYVGNGQVISSNWYPAGGSTVVHPYSYLSAGGPITIVRVS